MSIVRIGSNARMSQAVIVNGMVYLAGQVGTGDTVAEQTRSALSSIEDLLQRSGSNKESLVSALILLADMTNFQELNKVWDTWVADVGTPVRASCQAPLAGPQYLVEIIITAVVAQPPKA